VFCELHIVHILWDPLCVLQAQRR